jgi:hypothetical protein
MKTLEAFLENLRKVAEAFPDKRLRRSDNVTMADATLSAFSLFFMQSASFLEHQKRMQRNRSRSNCQTLFGIQRIPSENHIRSLLDAVAPERLQPCFDQVLAQMQQQGGLSHFHRLDGRVLIALDGTEYFCSEKRSCPHCLTRKRSNGKTESYHALLAATVVAPGHNRTLSLMPEFIVTADGSAKQDCERNAAKRWLRAHGERMRGLRPVYLGDALFSSQPMCEAVLAQGGDFLFVCKEDSHKTLYEYLRGIETEQHTETERKRGRPACTYCYRWVEGVPLRDGADALPVQWLGLEIRDAADKITYRGAFVTSFAIHRENVAEIAACARARWKIENESFNVLKNHGYHMEHNFGHGRQYLAQVFVTLNLLAFAFHTVCDCLEELWQKGRALFTRVRFFAELHTVTNWFLFSDWDELCGSLVEDTPPSP